MVQHLLTKSVLLLGLVITAHSAHAYSFAPVGEQAESWSEPPAPRKMLTEHSFIYKIDCTGTPNYRPYLVYYYPGRNQYRAVELPNYTRIGGHDFGTFEEAARVACGECGNGTLLLGVCSDAPPEATKRR
jgi:hypothetical protein